VGRGRHWVTTGPMTFPIGDLNATWSNAFTCGSEEGSYLRLIDSCITQLKFQGPCNESKEEKKKVP